MGNLWRRIWVMALDDRGASLMEYVLLATLIAIVSMVAIILLGGNTSVSLGTSGSTIANAG